MLTKRSTLALAVAIGLAPGTCIRSEVPPPDFAAAVLVEKLATGAIAAGPLTLEAAWHLRSDNDLFGGYSTLSTWNDDSLLAASDVGKLMVLDRADPADANVRLDHFFEGNGRDRFAGDIESLVVSEDGRSIWTALEHRHQFIGFDRKFRLRDAINSPELAQWGDNSAAEAMVRLPDGRFFIIAEEAIAPGMHEAYVFPRDPLSHFVPERFIFRGVDGYSPTDATLLPDGDVAVLLRAVEWGWPPRFRAMIVRADVEGIRAGSVWSAIPVARIEPPIPSDNYEGIEVVEEDDGSWKLWLISDDNFSRNQRTLLLKFDWDRGALPARQKARR